jgi:hypothetical protein
LLFIDGVFDIDDTPAVLEFEDGPFIGVVEDKDDGFVLEL